MRRGKHHCVCVLPPRLGSGGLPWDGEPLGVGVVGGFLLRDKLLNYGVVV